MFLSKNTLQFGIISYKGSFGTGLVVYRVSDIHQAELQTRSDRSHARTHVRTHAARTWKVASEYDIDSLLVSVTCQSNFQSIRPVVLRLRKGNRWSVQPGAGRQSDFLRGLAARDGRMVTSSCTPPPHKEVLLIDLFISFKIKQSVARSSGPATGWYKTAGKLAPRFPVQSSPLAR